MASNDAWWRGSGVVQGDTWHSCQLALVCNDVDPNLRKGFAVLISTSNVLRSGMIITLLSIHKRRFFARLIIMLLVYFMV